MSERNRKTKAQLLDEIESLQRRLVELEGSPNEEALRHSEERFRNVVESTPMSIFLYDLEPDDRESYSTL